MKEEQNKNEELLKADELAASGDKAFQSYTWKLKKSQDDSCNSSETNPYSEIVYLFGSTVGYVIVRNSLF